MDDAGIPRHGQRVLVGDTEVGLVTSGTKSPTLGTFIGMAYVARDRAGSGTALVVDIRGRRHAAHVVDRPFYRRPR
jgi:aminomethyltransferase